jgi:S-DNA-T family DNA segregation ATPase FtsK/SpoIIIE
VTAALAEADDEPVSRPRLVVVEGAVEAEGAAVLSALSAVARAARRSQTLVVFEYELGHAAGVWELLGELRLARWGLSLQPDDADSGSPLALDVGRLRRGDLPPGRGFVVDGGRARPVQLASAWGSLED